ncbi:methyltransferase [Candidatus Woesearchaeota archaeon]|nr:methyltransferase [Candidatus Woesearchaeota archaeon]|tara:strand:- start:8550 stop:9794 length:1245 start_codon:yes stop_codon:yes gene_type:complete
MTKPITRRNTCRLCESKNLELGLKLAPTPIGDAYIPREGLTKPQNCYPVELFLCKNCGLSQLLDILNPEDVYCDYIYKTSDSLGLVTHFKNSVNTILQKIRPDKNSLVVDIGSNDGSFLKFFKERSMRVLGVDPAREIANEATRNGIETLPTFFDGELASKIKKDYGTAQIITINNAMANIDDVGSLVEGVKSILGNDGVFIFETGYFVDLIQKLVFDNIYHEHLCYFTVNTLKHFFDSIEMELVDVERIQTKGGSIRCIVQLSQGSRTVSPSVNELIKLEEDLKIHEISKIKEFGEKLNDIKKELLKTLNDLKEKGKTIAGYGASVGVTTVLYNFELGEGLLDYIVDDNPIRQNLFSPGLHIPVLSSDSLYEKNPDYVVILAWQYSKPIIAKHEEYLKKGGHFINFLPKIEVI